jgi:hypothetical protein
VTITDESHNQLTQGLAFVGPTATVTTTATQRITGSVTAMLYTPSSSVTALHFSLCYRASPSGSLTPFSTSSGFPGGRLLHYGALAPPLAGSYMIASYPATSSVVPGQGTWDVGYCAYSGNNTIIEDSLDGWFQVTN